MKKIGRMVLTDEGKEYIIPVVETKETRCPYCNRLIFKGEWKGSIEIKCPRKFCQRLFAVRTI